MAKLFIKILSDWYNGSVATLEKMGVVSEARIPSSSDDHPWKASIGFFKGEVIASFTVWELEENQAEFLVVNSSTGQTTLCQEYHYDDPEELKKILADTIIEIGNF